MTIPAIEVTPATPAAPTANPAPAANDPNNPVVAVVTDPTPVAPQNAPAPAPASESEAIERARQQEKDKLYPRLATMEEELKTLRSERDARLAAEAAQAEAEAEAERQRKVAETSAKDLLTQAQNDWQKKFDDLQAERELERVALAKDAELASLRAYVQEQVRVNSGEIAPQLLDLVTGNTQEEVNASIAAMKAKTAEILESVKEAQIHQRSQMRGVSVASSPGSATDAMSGQSRQVTAQQLKDMPLSEYAKYRPQLGVTGNSTTTNRGLFD